MATEVTVKIRDNPLGQAFLVQPEEWDLCLSEIRSILTSQEVETPFEYRFLTSNGNVVSSALEKNMTFRDIVEREPFAEVKKEDTSLQSAEERVTTQICLISVGESGNRSDEQTEIKCPLLKKIPHLLAVKDSIPCMRNVFNVNTLLKVAFILTCLLFLMVFVLMLFLHILFGIGAMGGYAGYGYMAMPMPSQQQQTSAPSDQEALTALKIKLSEIEVAQRFEIQDLKHKLAELEDIYMSQFKELEAARKELAEVKGNQLALEQQYTKTVDNFGVRLSGVEDSMLERWDSQHKEFISDTQAATGQEEPALEKVEVERGNGDGDQLEKGKEEYEAKEEKSKSKEGKKKNKDKGKKKDKKNKKKQ